MKIDSLKDLEKLVKLCRKLGIDAVEIGDLKFNLGQPPQTIRKNQIVQSMFSDADIKIPKYNPVVSDSTPDIIKTDELTQEQLLFYSSDSEQ